MSVSDGWNRYLVVVCFVIGDGPRNEELNFIVSAFNYIVNMNRYYTIAKSVHIRMLIP